MGLLKRRIIEAMEPKEEPPMRHANDLLARIRSGSDESIIEALDELLPRWILVSERLPEEGQIVIACCSDVPPESFTVAVCTYGKHLPENEYGFRTDWAEDIRPTHWMPIPEPPEVTA